jgi:hypothetical protein
VDLLAYCTYRAKEYFSQKANIWIGIKNNPYCQKFDTGVQMAALGVISLSLHYGFEG